MSNVKYMKDPSVKVNSNRGHNRPIVSSTPGEYAYLSPFIREVCVQCKDLNVYVMNVLNSIVEKEALEDTTLAELNAYYPEVLQRVIYDQSTYNNVITNLPLLCSHNKRNGECTEENCTFNTSGNE